jgi:GNAT superfamily N-acetyltransferase
MAGSEPGTPDTLTLSDLDGALALSDAAGWNQTADDWALFITRGQVLGCRAPDGSLVATAGALPYEGAAGWISMVLVARAWQHRGLATLLLQRCIQFLRAAGMVPVLDATPAGEAVYRRLGFERGLQLARWEAELAPGGGLAALPGVRRTQASDTATLVQLDGAANGVSRGFLLGSFLARAGSRAWLSDDGQGFVIVRQGRRAAQLGPLVATSATQAVSLLATALAGLSGRVFIDALSRWPVITQWLQAHGFGLQRWFVRMALGNPPVLHASERLFALAGPEFG